MRLIAGIGIVLIIVSGGTAETIDLSGTVKDGKGNALPGAVVTLASDKSMKDTTDTSGEFTISNATPIRKNGIYGTRNGKINSICIAGDQLLFSMHSSASKGMVSIFSVNGKRDAAITITGMEPGTFRWKLPVLASGIYIMHVSIDRFDALLQLVSTGDDNFHAAASPE